MAGCLEAGFWETNPQDKEATKGDIFATNVAADKELFINYISINDANIYFFVCCVFGSSNHNILV